MSAHAVRAAVTAFSRKFPYIASTSDAVTVAAEPLAVKLRMHESMQRLAQNDYIPRLKEFLQNNYITPIAVETETVSLDESGERGKEPTVYEISGVKPVFGAVNASRALSVADVSGNTEDVAVCGVLTMSTDLWSKNTGRKYEKFALYDGSDVLKCFCFPRDGFSLVDANLLNKTVVAVGNTEVERGRSGEVAMSVRALALAECSGIAAVSAPPLPQKYVTVKPLPYEEYVQTSLFSGEEKIPESLSGTFVAFDFETTGLSVVYDSPTELGAVKIVDGVITETFSTLIDPQRPIPEEVSKKTGITDAMVKGKPLFEDVLPDFYKFSYGCALVGHNIAFDFPFLLKYGNKHGYTFGDRKTFDTLGMAPRAIPGIDTLTLDNVLQSLGLVNDNAHRALSDATATAKAFIAMNKRICAAK